MRIALAGDHNGIALKARLTGWLTEHGHLPEDLGAAEDTETVDYPPLCAAVCRQVTGGTADRGIVLGGSGLSRAALYWRRTLFDALGGGWKSSKPETRGTK